MAETGFAQAGSQSVTVSFGAAFDNPVVIASLISAHDGGAAVARVSNVTATGFDVAVQETGDQDGVHGVVDISWIVVEAGSWQLADGTMIEAGLAEIGATARQGFTALSFEAGFAAGPAVLSQTQTAGDAAFVKTRMQGVDADGFAVGLEEEEAATWGAHWAETVGWLALDMGAASDGFEFAAGATRATHNAVDVALSGARGAVAGAASFHGPDAAAARIDMTADGFAVHIEEDLVAQRRAHPPPRRHPLAGLERRPATSGATRWGEGGAPARPPLLEMRPAPFARRAPPQERGAAGKPTLGCASAWFGATASEVQRSLHRARTRPGPDLQWRRTSWSRRSTPSQLPRGSSPLSRRSRFRS